MISLPYILGLILIFINNHLSFFLPKIINYPFDKFSMLIDLHFLAMKICLSISSRTLNINMSKFFFTLAIFIYLFLYFTYYIL